MGLASLTSTRMSNTAHGDLGAQLFTQPSHVPSGLNTNQLPVRLTQAYGSTDRHSVGSGLPSDEAQHGPSSRMPPAQSRFGPVHAQARASAPGTTTGAPQNGTAGTGEPVSIPAAKGQPPAQRHNLQELLHADYETLDDMQQGQLNQKKHQQPHALQTFLNASASQPGPSTQADTAAEGHASSSKAEAATASAQSAPLPVPLTSSALEQLHNATDSIQPHTQRGHAKKMALVGRWVAAMDLSHAPLVS